VDIDRLLKAHLGLECIGVNPDGLLIRIPGPYPDTIPRFYVTRHKNGYMVYVRQDQPEQIRKQLSSLSPEEAFRDHEQIKEIFGKAAPCEEVWEGRSYIFPDTITPADSPNAIQLNANHKRLVNEFDAKLNLLPGPIYAIIVDNHIESACVSSRENELAAEAWVQTSQTHRQRGYGSQVTAAWANNLQKRAKIPFYSHRLGNIDSEGVARRLDLIWFIDDVGYI
jgi:hypothetical protein